MKIAKKFKEELKLTNPEKEELVVRLDESNKKNEFLRNQISSQVLLPLLATSRLGVLDWNLWCIWAIIYYWAIFALSILCCVMCFVTDCQRGSLLGSKTLGTNVLELQFVICWQTMVKTFSIGLGFLKVCLFVKLESSELQDLLTKSARLDRSNLM